MNGPRHRRASDRYALGMVHGVLVGTGMGLIVVGLMLAALLR
ncbi:hypothetical protein SAMN05443665_102559 [Actinomadura meyerae]|jgi:hypothetical protein|uniref:Uncharacterized protein n=1 Tax=Actinomadura meyerae TaxID=240840 RepID=A0A239M2C3_9ACTN|nr:hypothetical protein [Actinomadura meyerae]SNT36233.1 hypothetical protein SAMN05443665_102559 [Actinomadura meyerae]